MPKRASSLHESNPTKISKKYCLKRREFAFERSATVCDFRRWRRHRSSPSNGENSTPNGAPPSGDQTLTRRSKTYGVNRRQFEIKNFTGVGNFWRRSSKSNNFNANRIQMRSGTQISQKPVRFPHRTCPILKLGFQNPNFMAAKLRRL
ncbi:hypothetical protein FXO37_33727 [Capsicum annuum]|nr:hypothetical protein FXO37_33727 [Capsicum annuum]